MELALAWDRECCKFLLILIQSHLPKSRCEIQPCENCGIGPPNVADAFSDRLHGVLVDMGVLVQFTKVLDDPESLARLVFHNSLECRKWVS